MRVLVTGANGFVGRSLVLRLATRTGCQPVAAVRTLPSCESVSPIDAAVGGAVRYVALGDLTGKEFNPKLFDGVYAVVHCAARVHVMRNREMNPLTAFRAVNVDGALQLAKQAASAGVKRFVFLSTIKVNGEMTAPGASFQACDAPAPEDAYGLSKLEAERGLLQLAAETGMEVVIIRPPLVYGAGVKGNFASMIRLIEKGIPLPLGAIHNRRSMVGIDNLTDLIIRCLEHPAAVNQVFLAGDGQDLSTTELIRALGMAMNKRVRLVPVPAAILVLAARLVGKRAVAQRLLGSLRVDITKASELLDWRPRYSVEEGLRRCFDGSNQRDRA